MKPGPGFALPKENRIEYAKMETPPQKAGVIFTDVVL
jgi:hypothetical protein